MAIILMEILPWGFDAVMTQPEGYFMAQRINGSELGDGDTVLLQEVHEYRDGTRKFGRFCRCRAEYLPPNVQTLCPSGWVSMVIKKDGEIEPACTLGEPPPV